MIHKNIFWHENMSNKQAYYFTKVNFLLNCLKKSSKNMIN